MWGLRLRWIFRDSLPYADWSTNKVRTLINKILVVSFYSLLFLLVFSISSYFGFFLTSLIASSLLTISYLARYRKEGLGVELAYWAIAYVSFCLALLGVALLQSHADCWSLIGDCYQQTLPPWLYQFKIIYNLALIMLNSVVVAVVIQNVRSILKR